MIVASVSGGKDSTAMVLHLREQKIEHQMIFCDTGWEHPKTYEYLDFLEERLGQTIWRLKSAGMVEVIRAKAMFPSRVKRFCTEQLKVFPLRDFIERQSEDVVNAVGIRAQESRARAEMPEREWSDALDCEVWRPIHAWTFEDVVAIHKRHGIEPNPLYLTGASRVGCWPCIFSRKSEIRFVAETDPDRIDLIEMLESEISEKANVKARELGKPTIERSRTFFSWKDKHHPDPRAPIRDIVEWSKTAYGGVDPEEFQADALAREGCMRWGLCSTEPEPDE